jgi:glucose dehydrogenase
MTLFFFDIRRHGQLRKVLVRPERNGYLYTLREEFHKLYTGPRAGVACTRTEATCEPSHRSSS